MTEAAAQKKALEFLAGTAPGMLLYTNTGKRPVSYLFTRPKKKMAGALNRVLAAVDRSAGAGYYAAGYACYGADARASFSIYGKPLVLAGLNLAGRGAGGFRASGIKPAVTLQSYIKVFNRIKSLIRDGEVYQVNYTFPLRFDFSGSPADFFYSLNSRQKVGYAAFIRERGRTILSVSPEMFFELNGRAITMKPMKGTLLKPATATEVRAFRGDKKTIAENLMIVDLVRNDLGRVCSTGSVKAGSMFTVEEYDTIYQMTSNVSGMLDPGVRVKDIFAALFPSGSVTGAPKKAAMGIIRQLEGWDRGIYTGAIGFVGPRMGTAVFNIPIRTIVLEGNRGVMGVGSGVVADSSAKKEYEECLGKAKFLEKGICLIESLLYEGGKYFLFNQHLDRLARSAKQLGYAISRGHAERALMSYGRRLAGGGRFKVRMTVSKEGEIGIGHSKVGNTPAEPARLAVSGIRTQKSDRLLRHKTTRRELYDSEYAKYSRAGYDDVIFLNNSGEVTEAHSSNIFIFKNGKYYTPPVSCGLLPGTYRGYLLKNNPDVFREKVLRLKDLRSAEAVFICNSVRGMRRAVL